MSEIYMFVVLLVMVHIIAVYIIETDICIYFLLYILKRHGGLLLLLQYSRKVIMKYVMFCDVKNNNFNKNSKINTNINNLKLISITLIVN